MNRRELMVGAGLLASVPGARAQTPRFQLLDGTLYTGKPQAVEPMLPVHVIYYWHLWENFVRDQDAPDIDAAIAHIGSLDVREPRIICLDVEHWDTRDADVPEQIAAMGKYHLLVAELQKAYPEYDFGFYGQVPITGFWEAARQNLNWLRRNERMEPLARQVDVLFPSKYTFYPRGQANWVDSLIGSLRVWEHLGKRQYPFVWPFLNRSYKTPPENGDYIGDEFWRLQLETCYEHADGCVVWGAGHDFANNANVPWNTGDMRWYDVVRDFAAERNLT